MAIVNDIQQTLKQLTDYTKDGWSVNIIPECVVIMRGGNFVLAVTTLQQAYDRLMLYKESYENR